MRAREAPHRAPVAPVKPHALSGRPVEQLDLDRLRDGELGTEDIRISAETLTHQAEQAERAGNPQLAESLRRGAEMTALGDDELMRMYDALRPRRSTVEELTVLAADLADRGMPRCAALVREAAEIYARRGLTP